MHGQVLMGLAGSGKSSYCKAVQDYMKELDREIVVVNLDPGNEDLPYNSCIDVCDLINVEDAMVHEGLGPNGAMIFCMEHLEEQIEWLHEKIAEKPKNSYFLFDCPGQIELYTNNESVHKILHQLIKKFQFHLVAVFLLDSTHLSNTRTFISLLTTTLCFMMRIELPSMALLGKSDLIKHEELPFNIDYFTEVNDLKYLLDQDEGRSERLNKFQEGLIDVVERYGLVSFSLFSLLDTDLLRNVIQQADKLCLYQNNIK